MSDTSMVLVSRPPTPVRTGGISMPASENDTLYDLGLHILTSIQEIFAREGVALPVRQFVTAGMPAQDCEQVTVAFQQTYIGPPGDEASLPQRCDGPRSASYQIAITRCITTVDSRNNVPTPQQIQKDAQTLMRDAWILMTCIKEVDDYLGVIVTLEASDAQGGLQSTMMTLTLGVV